jgi:hypothetical protein
MQRMSLRWKDARQSAATLSLTLEIGSRTLSHFDKVGLIKEKGKAVRIRDLQQLHSVAQCLVNA